MEPSNHTAEARSPRIGTCLEIHGRISMLLMAWSDLLAAADTHAVSKRYARFIQAARGCSAAMMMKLHLKTRRVPPGLLALSVVVAVAIVECIPSG